MEKIKRKLFIITIAALLAMTAFVGVSYAWMTISTNPEISGMSATLYTDSTILLSADGETYEQYIDLSEKFANFVSLKPVSTWDGINWFIPTYDDGGLKDTDEFLLDNSLEHANVLYVDEDGEMLTGNDLIEAMQNGYYVYADFWMKSEESNGCLVRLSVPGDANSLAEEELLAGQYGTYVLPKLRSKVVSEVNEYSDVSNRSFTAVRIGFLIYETERNDGEQTVQQFDADGNLKDDAVPSAFIIYEPNADLRSASGIKPTEEGGYVAGFQYDSSIYIDGNYLETKPIARIDLGNDTFKNEETAIPSTNLIIQKSCNWDVNTPQIRQFPSKFVNDTIPNKLANNVRLNSNDVIFSYFYDTAIVYGKLISAAAENPLSPYIELDAAVESSMSMTGSNLVYTLTDTDPVMIRMFVWVEGQDADCWNDIATGSFTVNIELAGETIN